MGRTGRKRKSKKEIINSYHYRLGSDNMVIEFIQWLSKNGWKKELTLHPTDFPLTGRGLQTKKALKKGDVLVKIPYNLLITAHTVCNSAVYEYLDKTMKYNGHEILALYLIWEKHLEEDSFWFPYIKTLPHELSTPLCWSEDPLNLPEFISNEIKESRDVMLECYSSFLDHIENKNLKCTHCGLDIPLIFNKIEFIWAWCIVNTRAVYIPLEKNLQNITNSLALAPYLDLFNHVSSARVEAMLVETEKLYIVKTLVPIPKNSQVFIEYGAHSNLKLMIDYGFTVPHNPNDSIKITLEEIYDAIKQTCIQVSEPKYLFLKQHNLLKNLCLTREGLCWKTESIIYIFTCNNIDLKLVECKVYSSMYTTEEMKVIKEISAKILKSKSDQFNVYLEEYSSTCEDKEYVVIAFLKECIQFIDSCYEKALSFE